ncbi:unnamed protein product [Meloidogyne enterolobii]|uniref:Uncharacterized protein n=1 Tax=Meloidogyne enterolobii TaxID=390850 RepID=A0ACB1AFE3_MELEN
MLSDEQREAYVDYTILNLKKFPDFHGLGTTLHFRIFIKIEIFKFKFKTIKEMKANKDFDIAALLHRQAWDEGGAHRGPQFLVFHREKLKFIGSTNSTGQVIDGPFSPWETLMNTDYIQRDVGRHGSCYKEE